MFMLHFIGHKMREVYVAKFTILRCKACKNSVAYKLFFERKRAGGATTRSCLDRLEGRSLELNCIGNT